MTRWIEAQGWTSICSHAAPGKKGASGGVAIIAKRGIGLSRVADKCKAKHRLVLAKVEAPGYDEFLGAAVYLRDGIGLTGVNNSILAEIHRVLKLSAIAGIFGGDWNLEPTVLGTSSFLGDVNGVVVKHEGGGGVLAQRGSRILLWTIL